MWHHAQGFEKSTIVHAYKKIESEYVTTVKTVLRRNVTLDANIVSSRAVQKIKVEDDEPLRLKVRTAPQSNESSDALNLHSDCGMCSPIGSCVVATAAAAHR